MRNGIEMRAIQKLSPKAGFQYTESAARPIIGPQDVLIKVKMAGICGTDLHITQWDKWSASRIKLPLIYGHEFCGHVEAVGEGCRKFQQGDYVTAEMHLPCGQCIACEEHKPHICKNLKIAGVDRDGCYADYIVLPESQIIALPPEIPFEVAACLDAIGNGVHAASKVPVAGKTVLITGCGPIGLFGIAASKALGATTILASDIQQYRLDLALKAGASKIYNAANASVVDAIQADQFNIDVVLEMSGHSTAFETAIQLLKPSGSLVMLGIPAGNVVFDIPEILFKELSLKGVTGRRMFETWELMLSLITTGKLDVRPVITHYFEMNEFAKAIELVASGQSGKVILTY